jgi:hypothetical protein
MGLLADLMVVGSFVVCPLREVSLGAGSYLAELRVNGTSALSSPRESFRSWLRRLDQSLFSLSDPESAGVGRGRAPTAGILGPLLGAALGVASTGVSPMTGRVWGYPPGVIVLADTGRPRRWDLRSEACVNGVRLLPPGDRADSAIGVVLAPFIGVRSSSPKPYSLGLRPGGPCHSRSPPKVVISFNDGFLDLGFPAVGGGDNGGLRIPTGDHDPAGSDPKHEKLQK